MLSLVAQRVVAAMAGNRSAFRVGTGSFSVQIWSIIVVVYEGCLVRSLLLLAVVSAVVKFVSIFFRVLDAGPVSVSERTAPLPRWLGELRLSVWR